MLLSMEEFRAFQPKKPTYALFGWPLGHTMSPELHAQLFEASGQDAAYIGVAVPPDDLAEAFDLAKAKLRGINCTIPHKKAVIELLDGVDTAARDLHSVNTVAFRDGKAIGYNTDMSRVAPKAHMTSAIWSWNPVYENVVEKVRAGTWKNGSFWYGMETGVVDIAPYGPMVPQNVRDLTDAAKADIKSGKLVVFTGPIKDQKGVERIPTGTVPSDKELLGMDWFVEGVIGTIN